MIIEVGEQSGIYCIEHTGMVRAYYVAPEQTLIDTGNPGNVDRILSGLAQIGVTPLEVKRIILTHHHWDHVGNLFELKRRTGAEVVAHPRDAEYITGKRHRRAPRNPLGRLMYGIFSLVGATQLPNVDVDRAVEDGDRVGAFTVVHTPGHTPGHICLLYGKYLFSGDLLEAAPGTFEETPQIFHADVPLARASIGKVAKLDFESLLPAHRPPYAFGAANKVRDLAKRLGVIEAVV